MDRERRTPGGNAPTKQQLRVFGFVLSAVLLFWAVLSVCAGHWLFCAQPFRALLRGEAAQLPAASTPALAAFAASALMLLLAVLLPRALSPLQRLAHALGLALRRLVSRLLLLVVFFLLITPLGWLRRCFRRDPLGLRFDPSLPSYWLPRDDNGFTQDRFRDPF